MGDIADDCHEIAIDEFYSNQGSPDWIDEQFIGGYSPVSREPSTNLDHDCCLHGYIKNYCVMSGCKHQKI